MYVITPEVLKWHDEIGEILKVVVEYLVGYFGFS